MQKKAYLCKMRRFLILILLGVCAFCRAGNLPQGPRHQVRVGWGDMIFETLAFHKNVERSHVGYTGHIFTDYQFRCSKRVSVGAQADFEGIFWDEATGRSRNYNTTVLGLVNFHWMDSEWVRLYSGLGAGVLIAFDNAHTCKLVPATNLTFLGVQVGKGHWAASLDLGMLNAFTGTTKVYMLGSRMLSASVVYRW